MRRVKKYSPNVSPPQGDSAILSALYARHFRVLRRRPNNAIPPYHQGFLAPSRALLLSRILLHHTSPLSHQQPTQQPTNRAQENIKKLESTVATANADIVELNLDIKRLKLIITCFMESIGKQRNLRDNEYAGLFKGADLRINTKFVQVTTTLPTFTVEKAEVKLEKAKLEIEKAEAKIKEAKLEIEKAKLELKEAKSGSGSVSAFKLNPNVVEAALPSMPATAYPMGALPSKMKEVDVVGIKNPYFETAISSLYVRSRYYPPLWDEIKANIVSPTNSRRPMITIVIGQPGIGKSVGFGNYCVLRCMADLSKTIIIVISMETVDVLFPPNNNNKEWQKYTADTRTIRSLRLELQNLLETMDVKDHKALVVHDVKSAKGEKALPYQAGFLQPLQQLVARVHMVILTSPQESNYGLAVKEGVPFTEKYLPVWSRDELECAGFDVQNKYEYCGGVPRSYAVTIDIIQNKQANASRAFDARLMRRAELSDQCSSVLVKLDIAPDFNKKIGLSPVSRSAERLLRESNFNDVSHYFHDRVQGTSGTQKGLVLERWFMFWIRGSTNSLTQCVIQNLSTGANSTLRVSPIHYIKVEGNNPQILKAANEYHLQLNDGQSVLVQPNVSNFPVVDLLLFTKVKDTGVMWEVDAFQVTVSPSHAPTKASAKKFSEVFDAGSCRLRHFIWVGLTAGARSAGQNGGVTTTQKVEGGGDFFPKKQYRLDMAQVVPK